jgi:hypothetical protein
VPLALNVDDWLSGKGDRRGGGDGPALADRSATYSIGSAIIRTASVGSVLRLPIQIAGDRNRGHSFTRRGYY